MNVTNLSYTYENGVHRASGQVDGSPLWFESSDVRVYPAPEAFASALLIAALEQGTDLLIDGPISPAWLSNVQALMKIYRKWWKYPAIAIQGTAEKAEIVERGTETGLCFTAGRDSFYSLLRGRHRPDYLVFAHGYDIRLDDTNRMGKFRLSLEAIAEGTKTKPAVIRTNLREHPAYGGVSWLRSHGSALAAVGYIIPAIRRLVISSSFSIETDKPWGSSWKTDPLWSSDKLEIVQEGESVVGSGKTGGIVDEPLVRKYIRVCWENRNERLNCCQCEKCLRTMLSLARIGKLKEFTAFEDQTHMVQYIDQIQEVDWLTGYKRLLSRGGLEPELAEAVRRLVRRITINQLAARPFVGLLGRYVSACIPRPIRVRLRRWLGL